MAVNQIGRTVPQRDQAALIAMPALQSIFNVDVLKANGSRVAVLWRDGRAAPEHQGRMAYALTMA